FALIMGEDNLRNFHKWKSHELILERYPLYVYPRVITADETVGDAPIPEVNGHPNVHRVDAPVMRISASFIRQAIRDKKDVRYLLTEPVFRYATEMHFYEK
ncbi:MAG: nicotinic acid mononucleotide adenylyltransferase, partial [Bacteroidota bacterium]